MATFAGTSWPISTDQLLERLADNRWAPLVANVAALAVLTYGLAQWTWRLLQPSAPPPAAASTAIDPNQGRVDLQTVLGANLFGQPPVASASSVNPNQLPLSSLNLVLTGVMAQGKGSFALLSVNGAPETPLTIGQEVTAGAILAAVYADRVVLRRGSALESVMLKDSDATLPAGSIVTSRPDTAASAIRPLGGGMFNVDRRSLTQNLTAETLSQAAVTPSAGGLVVREIQAGGLFEKLGLQSGDVVRTINGQPVASLDDVAKVYAQFAASPQAGRVMVEVVRGGKSETLQYQMQ